jgi:hypothetical protein
MVDTKKKQQMPWTKRGAHLLLQVRTHVLNDELRTVFCRCILACKPERSLRNERRSPHCVMVST